ncbi:MAG: MarR family transcriptional regulator [Actinobacteria bacterium]|nr:MarR family transcriptional regulator [Actinomycetota bacterium]
MTRRAPVAPDVVDAVAAQWRAVRPDVDHSPLEVVARVSRLSRLVDRRLGENFARHGLEDWMYDVLATLRRGGPPYTLTPTELVRQAMVTTGAITNRVDRLEARGLVERVPGTDRRSVPVRLTAAGLALVDEVVAGHMALEDALLSALPAGRRAELADALRTVLVALGDVPAR